MVENVTFQDNGRKVKVVLPGKFKEAALDVVSNTTSLTVRGADGAQLLSIPQLSGTIDASQTQWKVLESSLEIELVKLGTETWASLEPAEVKAEQKESADAGSALEAREKVRLLFQAIMDGNISEVNSLARQVSPEGLSHVKDGNGRTALHFAAHSGQTETLEYLLDQEGLDINVEDGDGETALSLAAAAAQLPAVQCLLRRGAAVNLKKSIPQPLHRAAATGSRQIIEALIEAGAEKEASSQTGTPLLWAAGSGNEDAVKALLAAHVDPNAVASDGCGAILMATAGGECDIVEALLDSGADANLAAEGGVTALHAAAELGNMRLLKSLLKHGAIADAEDGEGSKAIQAAAAVGHRVMVEYLLPLTKPNSSDWTVDSLLAVTSSASEASPSNGDRANGGFHDKEKAAVLKRRGDEAFVRQDFEAAASEYSEALQNDASDEVLWSNRSAANLKLGKAEQALSDAQRSRTLKEGFMKAWFREGEASKALKKWDVAAQAYYEAYTLKPDDARLAKEFQSAVAEAQQAYKAGTLKMS